MQRLWHRLWPLNVRTHMMLWYVFIFAILILLFGVVFYFNLQTSLQTNVDAELRMHAQEIASGINAENGKLTIRDVKGTLPGLANPDAAQDTLTPGRTIQESHPDIDVGPLVRILNNAGSDVYTSPALQSLILPQVSEALPLHGTPWTGTITTNNGQTVRIYSQPLSDDGSIYAVVQVGESLTPQRTTLRSAVIELLMIGLFVLLLSLIGSYWLAARSFAPVEKMTSIAQRIEAGDLHERVPVPHAQDELQKLALTFNEMIERLEKSFAYQRRFVADASHELRTPVAAIRSMTDVALAHSDVEPPDEHVMVLRNVNAEAERMGHLISNLMSLARSDENKVTLEREPVRLDQLAADVVATMELLATEKDISLAVEAAESATVLGDEARLIQVLMNLIDNAITYTNAGGKITVHVRITDESVSLSVSDTGIGIAPEHLEHLFERFYRVDPARSRAAGGAGLGLAIADWVVHAHTGTIAVQSQPGQGTTFTARLPPAPPKDA